MRVVFANLDQVVRNEITAYHGDSVVVPSRLRRQPPRISRCLAHPALQFRDAHRRSGAPFRDVTSARRLSVQSDHVALPDERAAAVALLAQEGMQWVLEGGHQGFPSSRTAICRRCVLDSSHIRAWPARPFGCIIAYGAAR